jgi:tetratricopeptide (TPR) repeat protein
MLVFMRAVAAILAFLALLARALAQTPDPQQLFVDGIQAQQRGDFQTAIRDYQEFLRLRPNSFQAEVNLGAALAHEGQFDAAIVVYQSALSHAPGNNNVLLDLALAYYKKGDFPRAKKHFAAINRAEPNNVQVATLLGDTENRLGEPAEAVGVLAPLESKYSENLDFEYALGSALIASGQRREGVVRIEKVAKGKNSAEAYLLAGSTLLQLNEFVRARDDLDIALRLNPKLPGIYSLAGTARDNTGDLKGAEAAFREALKIDHDDFTANLYLGTMLYKRRQLQEARIYLEHALQLNPSSSMARYEFAMLESVSGQYEAALHDLQIVAKEDPNWLEPHIELATLYYRLHQPAEGAKERQIVEELSAKQQAKDPGTP